MGLLDDAIREHLELKRLRGADPGEVAREEQDALGPVRREVAVAAEPQPAEPEPIQDVGEDDFELDPAEQATALHRPDVAEEQPAAPDAPVPDGRELAPEDDFGFEDDEPPEGQVSPAGDETEADPEGEDVLEETPEFLQETPEHDRLWFEQRPPRDFDFDS
ncbi:MAG: hypothetical protein QOK31_1264 [Solirubrobacteraceae bacterium]|jgi:hypothetical protein|nr:hypothetical protein [Solirubrobacteraceae bacterium]